jgi:hypothetical protein
MLPEIVAGQADVAPAQWCDMLEKLIRHDPALRSQMLYLWAHVERVPVHDRSDHQIEPRSPVSLVLEHPIRDPALLMGKDRLGQ